MMNDFVEVDVNLMTLGKIKQKLNMDKKKAKEEAHPSSSQSSDAKFNTMMKTMEVLAMGDRHLVGQQ